MAYADQEMSGNKITAFILVALIHVAVGYALVTGLAYEAAKKVIQKVTTVDIKEEVKKEEPPPPPPKKSEVVPPPIVAPPPKVNLAPAPSQVETVREAPPAPIAPPVLAPPTAPEPPAPRVQPKGPTPKGRGQGNWVTQNDYPSRAQAEEREGVTRYRVTVSPDGRVSDCQITGSSGHSDLDQATCSNIQRRARFNPATDGEGQPTSGTFNGSVRWQLPQD